VRIVLEGAANVTVILERITARLARGLEPAQGPLTDAVRAFFGRRFESRGAFGGVAWAPLHASTVLGRLRAGIAGDAPLFRTGTVWASLTQSSATGLTSQGGASDRAFGYSVLEAGGRALRVGSWDPVLNLTEGGTRKMPARPVLPDKVPDETVSEWAAIVVRSLGLPRE